MPLYGSSSGSAWIIVKEGNCDNAQGKVGYPERGVRERSTQDGLYRKLAGIAGSPGDLGVRFPGQVGNPIVTCKEVSGTMKKVFHVILGGVLRLLWIIPLLIVLVCLKECAAMIPPVPDAVFELPTKWMHPEFTIVALLVVAGIAYDLTT